MENRHLNPVLRQGREPRHRSGQVSFEPMPKRVQDGAASGSLPDMKPAPSPSLPTAGALTIAEAKRGLALGLGVSPEAVEITIRG